MSKDKYDHIFKLVIIGDSAVGKTSIVQRFIDNSFDEDGSPTIGVDFGVKYLDISGKRIKTTIWDTAGQERFRTVTSSYYKGAQGVILVYDVTRRQTFQNIQSWLDEIDTYASNRLVKLLVCNKIDLKERTAVDREEAVALAKSKGMLFLECSAKTRHGISSVFQEICHKVLENPRLLASTTPMPTFVSDHRADQDESICGC
eukprot:TRINITY_DN512_c0_g1_i1.p1 TRINITY_DN512_c0_g1~~TRINITY_DN512_c0_g1_i1.p1  ORF type:complete len:202 (-),score=28.51 TRINITY_DN512_c0_g1_i1:160-765(-)